MKKTQKPTRRQKFLIIDHGLNPNNWFVERDTTAEMVIVHRDSGRKRTIRKAA